MKRRGFLGLLAAIPLLRHVPLPVHRPGTYRLSFVSATEMLKRQYSADLSAILVDDYDEHPFFKMLAAAEKKRQA